MLPRELKQDRRRCSNETNHCRVLKVIRLPQPGIENSQKCLISLTVSLRSDQSTFAGTLSQMLRVRFPVGAVG